MNLLITRIIMGLLAFAAISALATEFHVSVNGNDRNDGSSAKPFKTISAAAQVAQPGDVVTVHAGTYRERINPPRGGISDTQRIVYQAAPGEIVEIKGSEVVKNWAKVQADVWKVTLTNSFFGDFNPYHDLIHGDWFNQQGRAHHTGAVYINGEWLTEAARLDEMLKPSGEPLWFGKVDDGNTMIWAQFKGVNPNEQPVEINVRRTVFYPDQPGRNFITVRGFTMRHAATPWAPPTAEQIGLIGTHWSKGWIIESNTVSHSICSGIALGKYGDEFDNTSANRAEGYVKTIERAHAHAIPWMKEHIGHHVVRNNTVSYCEQAGIVGSLGCSFSTVTGNSIHDIHVRQLFGGAEMAGIKFHGAIDTEISRNHIYRTCRGLWLDWMAQGTHVTQNLFHDNIADDLFVEVNHGPFVVDNNIFLSHINVRDISEGGAFAHNLFTGKIVAQPERSRATPFHPPHSTTVAGLTNIQGGDDRFYNNVFVGDGTTGAESVKATPQHSPRGAGYGLWVYDKRETPLQTGGNVLYYGAAAYVNETNQLALTGQNPFVKLEQQGGLFLLQFNFGAGLQRAGTGLVTTALLGKAKIPDVGYENADGSPLVIGKDYFGQPRHTEKPSPGPFEAPGVGDLKIKVW